LITTASISSVPVAPIERILGIKAQSVQRSLLLQHRDIFAEQILLNVNELNWTDEHAKLHLYPVADGQFCLQLLYLQYTDEPEMAEVTWVEFHPGFFEQYPLSMLTDEDPFKVDHVTERQFSICGQSLALIKSLRQPWLT
jgi:hypothetical protein